MSQERRELTISVLCELLSGEVTRTGHDEELAADFVWIESADCPMIEVLVPTGHGGPIEKHLEKKGPGLHHLSFEAESLDAALRHASACGCQMIGENREHSGYEEFLVDPKATGGALLHVFRELDERSV